jgi:hypothetical protein
MVQVDAALYAAQRGKAFHKWVNDKVPGATAVVLSDATLYYDLAVGEVVMIRCISIDIETVSDDCTFELVSCDDVAGGGTPTALTGKYHQRVGATPQPHATEAVLFQVPIRVAYADLTF